MNCPQSDFIIVTTSLINQSLNLNSDSNTHIVIAPFKNAFSFYYCADETFYNYTVTLSDGSMLPSFIQYIDTDSQPGYIKLNGATPYDILYGNQFEILVTATLSSGKIASGSFDLTLIDDPYCADAIFQLPSQDTFIINLLEP